jgi:hypothetical protein
MNEKYIQIFNGYRGAYGVANIKNAYRDPDSGKLKLKPGDYRWNYEELTDQVYIDHLNGIKSIGMQPCNEDGETKYGIIDIDPSNYDNFDKKFVIDKIQEYKLPLIPILSKSGSLHLYIFMKKFVDAATLKSFLSNLLPLFNLKADTEIFPKQTQLTRDLERGGLRPGQFINLPYFNKTDRRALNIDGTEFTFDQFIPLVESNLVHPDELNKITEGIDQAIYDGADDEFKDGPPCLATLSKIMKNPAFDGKDRFMYNYHVFVKMKYEDTWKQKVKNAPVKYFEQQHANAWDDRILNAKIRSWNKSEKGFTCTESPINDHCKKGICLKKKFGVLAGSKGTYPILTNLKKIDLDPEPEYEFDVIKPDGVSTATVHCRSVEHVNDQRKRRNSISKAAGFAPPIIKGDKDQIVLDALWKTEKIVNPPIGTSSKEKLHDVLHAKINGPKAMNDAGFKTGTVLIEEGCAFFKFDKFYDKLKSKNWKYSEDKTGTMMESTYKKCEIEFLDQKRFPTKDKGKYNTPTKNVVKISVKEFENVPIHHTKLKHKKDII